MTKKIAVALVGVLVAGGLAACGESDIDADIDTGVVTKVQYVKKGSYRITVLEDDGEDDAHKVSAIVAANCSVGKRWPDCKR